MKDFESRGYLFRITNPSGSIVPNMKILKICTDTIPFQSLTYRFVTTESEEEEVSSLDEYISRMDDTQDAIYYLPGDSLETMRKSPLL